MEEYKLTDEQRKFLLMLNDLQDQAKHNHGWRDYVDVVLKSGIYLEKDRYNVQGFQQV